MTDLTFDPPECVRDRFSPRSGDWEEWFGALERRPDYVCLWSGPEVSGYEGAPYRIGGFFAEPLESVVGLRPFADTIEGTVDLEGVEQSVPYVLFEIEKLVRMVLHQSGLAFELLASPCWIETADDEAPCRVARSILERGLASGILAHYREGAGSTLDDEADRDGRSEREWLELVREVGTGAALVQGRATLHLGRLLASRKLGVERDEVALVREAEEVSPAVGPFLERLRDPIVGLPDEPDAYAILDEWLVETRLRHRREVPTNAAR